MTLNMANHYKILKARGLISPETDIHTFLERIEVQQYEICNAYADDINNNSCPSEQLIGELTKQFLNITNTFKHYNIDLPEQIGKVNKRHEELKPNLNVEG